MAKQIKTSVESESISNKSFIGEVEDNDLICYCFQYSRQDIEEDFINNNKQSTILAKVVLEKKKSRCDCAHKNPNGR